MSEVYPLTIVKDRYNGSYSGAKYTAWNCDFWDVPEEIEGGDIECMDFWENYKDKKHNAFKESVFVGKGSSPNEALDNLNYLMSINQTKLIKK